MEEKDQDLLTRRLKNIDFYSLIRDLIRNLWVIVLIAAIGGMAGNTYATYLGTTGSTYTTSATLIVSTKGSSSSTYSNLSTANSMASTLSKITDSDFMKKRICEELGTSDLDAQITATVVTDTNLLTLTVTDSTPQMSYKVLRTIIDNYDYITEQMLSNVMMEELVEPVVPKSSNMNVSTRTYTTNGVKAGIVIAVCLILFLSFMNDTIKNSNDLKEKLDAKPLGTVYFEQKYKTLKSRFRHKKTSLLVTNATASFGFLESYRKIAAKLSYFKKGSDGVAVVVTSILENEGKSTVATNIALTLAQNKYKVLLIDCDLRKPSQHLIITDSKEISTQSLPAFLEGTCELKDVIVRDAAESLDAIFSAKAVKEASELVAGHTMAGLIAEMRKYYDFIIMDTPPIAGAADSESLADMADASVLVVRYDQVQAADINDAIDTLDGCKAELAGCVLNGVHVLFGSKGKTGYGYGYGKYYGSYYTRATGGEKE